MLLLTDNIEANVEVAGARVEAGNSQLRSAVSHKRCSRKLTVIIVVVIVVVVIAIAIGIAIIVGVVKTYLDH
jgi:t-SNARE complex subunit (syntaxin)